MTTETNGAAAAEGVGESAELETRAKQMGWIAKEEFRGKEEDFIPADEYVRRGNEMLPILRANNRRLEDDLGKTRKELADTKKLVQESQSAIENLKEFQSSIALARVKEKKTAVLEGIRAARQDGDVEKETELTDELSDINTAIKEAAAKPAKAAKEEAAQDDEPEALTPDFQAFVKANSWFGKDNRRTAMAVEIGRELRAEGSALEGKAFLDEVARRTAEFFDESPTPVSKVEGGSRSRGASSGGAESYGRLPADAKAACDRLEDRMIGEGKGKYKDANAWRAHYAKSYFSQS